MSDEKNVLYWLLHSNMMWVSQLFCFGDKIPHTHDIKGGKFNQLSFRGFSSWSTGYTTEASLVQQGLAGQNSSLHGSQEAEHTWKAGEKGAGYGSRGHTP